MGGRFFGYSSQTPSVHDRNQDSDPGKSFINTFLFIHLQVICPISASHSSNTLLAPSRAVTESRATTLRSGHLIGFRWPFQFAIKTGSNVLGGRGRRPLVEVHQRGNETTHLQISFGARAQVTQMCWIVFVVICTLLKGTRVLR